jgi:hypothetical protein
MPELRILKTDCPAQWQEVLNQSYQYDFYHLAAYHALAESQGEGQALLFVFTEGDYLIALPILLRPLDTLPGLEQAGRGINDATSVYGYSGPLASHRAIPAPVLRNYKAALHRTFQELKVVSLFSRLHPLIDQAELVKDVGEIIPSGTTVSIDLNLPVEVQRARFSHDHKNQINRLRRYGVICLHDREKAFLPEFIEIYYETMRRVNAPGYYFFSEKYFQELIAGSPSNVHLFTGILEGQAISAGLFLECNGILQYHLSGTRDAFLPLSPMKLLLDEVRLWANCQGLRVFHLGGGNGGLEDSLFKFKAGLSDRRHQFSIWRCVLWPDLYEQLARAKHHWNDRNKRRNSNPQYFPAYRGPTTPDDSAHLPEKSSANR